MGVVFPETAPLHEGGHGGQDQLSQAAEHAAQVQGRPQPCNKRLCSTATGPGDMPPRLPISMFSVLVVGHILKCYNTVVGTKQEKRYNLCTVDVCVSWQYDINVNKINVPIVNSQPFKERT